MNAWHQDQVTTRPEGAEVVACNDFCENAALLYGNRAFTVQWHPEFESDFIDGLIRSRGKGNVPDPLLDEASSKLEVANDNALLASKLVGSFARQICMSDWINTLPDAAQAYIKGQRLDEVECIISDLPGIARGKAVPCEQICTPNHSSTYPIRSISKRSQAVGAKRRDPKGLSSQT